MALKEAAYFEIWTQVGITFRAKHIEKFKIKLLLFDIDLSLSVWIKLLPSHIHTIECCICTQHYTPSFTHLSSWQLYENCPHFSDEDIEAEGFISDSEFHVFLYCLASSTLDKDQNLYTWAYPLL